MSRYGSNKSAAPGGGSSQVWAGIFVGMVVGAGMAAVLTWYMMRSPSPFLAKAPVAEKLPPTQVQSMATTPASPSSSEKPRFEFYNVLTDKQNPRTALPPVKQEGAPKLATPVKPTESAKVTNYAPQILQVGSFSSSADAEKLKAKLAMIGAESHIQIAKVPDRGVFYRVRLGPYKTEEELNQARSFLKQNDLDSTPMRAQ